MERGGLCLGPNEVWDLASLFEGLKLNEAQKAFRCTLVSVLSPLKFHTEFYSSISHKKHSK